LLRACSHCRYGSAGGDLFGQQGAAGAIYLTYVGEQQRAWREKWPGPFGLHPDRVTPRCSSVIQAH
jgi:hypothetical protein